MDLENELRQAMAEGVIGMSAPETLAHDARRRHQRTVRRRTAVVMTAAGLMVAVAAIPAYQSFRPQTVGQNGAEDRHKNHHPAVAAPSITPPSASHSPAPTGGKPGSHAPKNPSHHPPGAHVPGSKAIKAVLGYLPPGINPAKTCQTQKDGSRETATCRWTGGSKWIEVRVVHDSALSVPGDLGLAPAVVRQVRIHGHPALRGDGPAIISQLMWIEHGGLGVWVGVSFDLTGDLTRIADSLHVT